MDPARLMISGCARKHATFGRGTRLGSPSSDEFVVSGLKLGQSGIRVRSRRDLHTEVESHGHNKG